MRAAVAAGIVALFSRWEGALPFPYLDVKCLVTTGIGDLADPLPLMLAMPWLDPDGSPSSVATVTDAFWAVKARVNLAQCGGKAFASVTKIRLSQEGIVTVVQRTLANDEAHLIRRWPEFESWPADAQMFAFSWAWAVGAASPFPKMTAYLRAGDFAAAATECWIGPRLLRDHTRAPAGTPVDKLFPDPSNPGIHPRNVANVHLLLNAATVQAQGIDPDVIYYPGTPAAHAPTDPPPS